ncbi:MAG: hypothetical protein ACRC28_17430 [Clostridium sp.]|uniref:hypothetical protein n=1 Tax=Clostridium sp. TaxID=1506 RepID=UPI003F2E735F
MRHLYDFLSPFLSFDEGGKFANDILKVLSEEFKINLLLDKFFDKNKLQRNLNLLGNNKSFSLSINRNKENLDEILKLIKEEAFDSFTCFNNGLSIPKEITVKYYIFLFSIFPLYEDDIKNKKYKERFLKYVPQKINNSAKTIVFSNVHLNLASSFGIEKRRLLVTYPFVKSIYKPLDKALAISYTKSRFNIDTPYIFASGAINEGFNLIKLLNYFKRFKENYSDTKLVIYITSIKAEFQEMIESENIIILQNLTEQDEVNLFNGAISFVDFSSQYLFNLNKIKALFTKTALVTDLTPLNLEYFEDFPIYELDTALDKELINHKCENLDLDTIEQIKEKFSSNRTKEVLIDIYKGDGIYE